MVDIKFTKRQIELLYIIQKGNADGSLCTVYDCIDKVHNPPSRSAMAHALKILVDRGYVTRILGKGAGQQSRFQCTPKATDIL